MEKLAKFFLLMFNFSQHLFLTNKDEEFWAFQRAAILLGFFNQNNSPQALKSSRSGFKFCQICSHSSADTGYQPKQCLQPAEGQT